MCERCMLPKHLFSIYHAEPSGFAPKHPHCHNFHLITKSAPKFDGTEFTLSSFSKEKKSFEEASRRKSNEKLRSTFSQANDQIISR